MVILKLALALAVCEPAGAAQLPLVPIVMPQDALGPVRRGEIEVLAADWVSAKSRAYRMMSVFLSASVKDGWNRQSMEKMLKQVRALTTQLEEVQYATSRIALEQIRASAPPSAERLARENAIENAFQIRALTAYGNLVPRILDESTQGGAHSVDGRVYAGTEWKISLTFDEGGLASRWQIERAGFTKAEYEAFEDRASDSLGYPRPKRS